MVAAATSYSCTVQLVEKLDCIVARSGEILNQDLSSELQGYTNLQYSDCKLSTKMMLGSAFELEGFTQNPQCHSKHAESIQTIGSDKFSLHAIQVPLSGRFTIARYFYSEEAQVKLPFMLRATYTIEGSVAKVLFKFEVDK